MPVDDHPVHESTKVNTEEFRYGCHNHQSRSSFYWAPSRIYNSGGTFSTQLIWIPNRASVECNYDLSAGDSGCEGCEHRRSN